MKKQLGVFSGKVLQGICGEETPLVDFKQDKLYIGDIVLVKYYESFSDSYHSEYITAICSNKYISYIDGIIKLNSDTPESFVMGIADVSITGEGLAKENEQGELQSGWVFIKLKGWEDIIEGEHWRAYGINYKDISHLDIPIQIN